MKVRQIVLPLLNTVIKVVAAIAVVMLIYRGAAIAYDYGYRVFQEEPVSAAPGIDVKVEVTMGKSVMQIGELLVQRGLIRDARLFYIQNLISHYKDSLRPGTYVLNTSMTMMEMMEVMSAEESEEDIFSSDTDEGSSEAGEADDAEDGGYAGNEED